MFLIEAERLIRLRGIPSPRKSYKTRLLHHVYTYLRIMAESILVSSGGADNEQTLRAQPMDSSSSSLRRFRVSEESLDAYLDPLREKGTDQGYNDIHLEILGKWNQTLYPEIYGVPETLMTLLSQSICLANDRKRLDRVALGDLNIANALMRHTKKLERNIWMWKPQEDAQSLEAGLEVGLDCIGQSTLTRSMVSAVHQAVLIYFYRRMHNVDAMMLQDLVRKTFDSLLPCLAGSTYDQDFASSITWPVFIASSEAATPELQNRALECLAFIDTRGAFFIPQKASDVVRQVWKKREETDDWTISWLDVLST